jgi:RND family efflux transporter MFP subunit
MANSSRRIIAIAVGVLGIGVLIAAAYVLRERWQPAHRDQAAVAAAAGAQAEPPGQTSTAAPRGEVTIDPQRQQMIGVRLAPAVRESMVATLRTTGIVRSDETRLADVNVKLDGWIRDLYVDYTGQFVTRGQPLFTLFSPDLLTTQQEYVLALKTRDQVAGSAIADAREYADRVVDAARQRLRLWDLSPEDIAALDETRRAPDVMTFRAPVSGFVLEKPVLRGMHITPGQTLYKIADLSSVWIEADVYEREMAIARVGQQATVTLDAYPGESFVGRAIYVFPFVEENSRTVKVRFQFANDRGRLRPGMYANVELKGTSGMALSVPADALLDSGTEQVVFVARGEGRFEPRAVKAGRRFSDRVEIVSGLAEGEQVATGATFFLDSESQLRAGLQNYEAPDAGRSQGTGSTTNPAVRLDITFRSQPDPPTTGESVFEVVVKDAKGQPVTDADVSVLLFMPAMPTMNMPAMRNETKLPHAGGGVYRGPGQVLMSGRWDVTVTVRQNGKVVGTKQLALATR